MTITSSKDVFFDQLKDVNSVEDQVTATMPDLAEWATETTLKNLLSRHHAASERHRQEVKAIFDAHDVDPGDDVCKAMEGLIEGGNQHIAMAGDPIVRDLLLIAHSSRIAHYAIAAYGFTFAIAESAGLEPEAQGLATIHGEQTAFYKHLAEIAFEVFGVPVGGLR